MSRTIIIPQFVGFIAHTYDIEDYGYGSVSYIPKHSHRPGADVPCSASWLMIL